MKLGFIGAGNMAGAILLGGAHGANVYDVNVETMRRREQECGAVPFSSADALIRASDVILLAVKPNVAPSVLRENRAAFAGKVVISIVAGLTVATLKALLPAEARFLRVMPNTPAMAGAGMTALCMEHTLTDAEKAFAESLFNAIGRTVWLHEYQMDGAVGVSGSGPAYAFLFLEAMADGGVALGLSRQDAYLMAAQTLLGSAKLALESGKHPGELKDMVCSPAGTTIQAVRVLEEKGLRSAVMEAVIAAGEMSAAMSKEGAK